MILIFQCAIEHSVCCVSVAVRIKFTTPLLGRPFLVVDFFVSFSRPINPLIQMASAGRGRGGSSWFARRNEGANPVAPNPASLGELHFPPHALYYRRGTVFTPGGTAVPPIQAQTLARVPAASSLTFPDGAAPPTLGSSSAIDPELLAFAAFVAKTSQIRAGLSREAATPQVLPSELLPATRHGDTIRAMKRRRLERPVRRGATVVERKPLESSLRRVGGRSGGKAAATAQPGGGSGAGATAAAAGRSGGTGDDGEDEEDAAASGDEDEMSSISGGKDDDEDVGGEGGEDRGDELVM